MNYKILIISVLSIFITGCTVNNKPNFQEIHIEEFSFTYLEPSKWYKETNNSMNNSLILNYLKRGPNGQEMSIALSKGKKIDVQKDFTQKRFQLQFPTLKIISDSITNSLWNETAYVINGEIDKDNRGILYVTAIISAVDNIEYNIVFSNLNTPIHKSLEFNKLMNGIKLGVKN